MKRGAEHGWIWLGFYEILKAFPTHLMILALIQARMDSTRLPGKVLCDIVGKPMLERVVERVRRAASIDRVVVATTNRPSDNAVHLFCREAGIDCFRGDEADVLDRFYQAAREFKADVIVRLTGDCPLLDPQVIDSIVTAFRKQKVDYASNVLRQTFPDGLDTEVFTFAALETAWREAKKPAEREHVTPYLRLSGKFRTHNVESPHPAPQLRWTVDEPADLEFVRRLYQSFDPAHHFGMEDILKTLAQKKDLGAINDQIIANEGYYKSLYQQATTGRATPKPQLRSQAMLARSRKVIPGGAQTFSKAPAQFVQGVSPVFLQRGEGCRVWDVDGNEYIDYIQGLLPNILGYGHREVNAAAGSQAAEGHSFSLPHPLEVMLAERLVEMIPCAEKVRFGRNGSDATSGAVRVARAFTNRERVACSGYHGWQDWYIGSTTRNQGVPKAVCDLTHPFTYNNLESLEKILQAHPNEFAAVILEPVNFTPPAPGFLQGVKDLARKHGAVLIFDEICSGFHLGVGGAQKRFGVTPDLATFGKAMGNGFAISAVLGRADIMDVFEDVFFSFTFAGEVSAMAAAMKVLDILEHTDALAKMEHNGKVLQDGFNALAKQANLTKQLECTGYPTWSLMKFRDQEGKDSFLVRSLFQQECVKRGLLTLVTHNMTSAHELPDVHRTLEIYASVIKTLAGWLNESKPERYLDGPLIQPVFRVRG